MRLKKGEQNLPDLVLSEAMTYSAFCSLSFFKKEQTLLYYFQGMEDNVSRKV